MCSAHFLSATELTTKSCTATFNKLSNNAVVVIKLEFFILSNGKNEVKVDQTTDFNSKFTDTSEVIENQVDLDLNTYSADDNNLDLNFGEKAILLSYRLSTDPAHLGKFTPGIDLHKVKSTKIYTVGKRSISGTYMVEALDEDNNILGSFLGGYFQTPCH
jgi:hypothetical protein